MRKLGVILTLIAFAAVCATLVEVDLMLKNSNTSIRVTVPEGAFQMIDDQAILASSDAENNGSISEKTPVEKYTPAAQCEFKSESEYVQFKKLWDIDSPALSAEDNALVQEQTPLTADLFEKCLLTANYLGIQGKYAERFAENMVKYGLFGKHSVGIVSTVLFSDRELTYDTFWDLLYAFLDQIDFKCRRIIDPSTKKMIMLLIESTNAEFKEIDKKYEGPSQGKRMRAVLYSELGSPGSQEKERNEAILGWLLLNIGGFSVDIQYPIRVLSDNITDLSQTIQNFTKENNKRACVYVEGLTLNIDYSCNKFSLLSVLQLVSDLSRLELFITHIYKLPNEELCGLAISIASWKSLKTLKIAGPILNSVEICSLVENLPSIEQLSLFCISLEDTVIDSLKKCVYLESLEIEGMYHASTRVQALVSHLSSLKKLRIKCQDLEPADTESFEACTQLESLAIYGEEQPSAAVQALAKHLPFLKELRIVCDILEPVHAESFEACQKLEKLVILGRRQPSTVVQALATCLPSLKELRIVCDVLEPAHAESFKACTQLEKLIIFGNYQPSTAVQALVTCLPSLKELDIRCDPLDPAAAESFKTCTQLEKLNIDGDYQTSSAIQALVSCLRSLKELRIVCQILEPAAAERFQACTQLEKLNIDGVPQPSDIVQELIRHLPSLKELAIECDVLEHTAAESFQACTQLEKLKILGATQPSAVVQAMVAHLPFLQDLEIKIAIADLSLADALRKCPIQRSLKLTVDQYTPGFLARYLKAPHPTQAYLELYNRDRSSNYSEEDKSAAENARAMGMTIYSSGL
ncbi:hypothetical protein NECID01_0554 [Nematocida sp. AWRm77]|nr:hypothetical protein NECID01_0554 [Nematocida sp. AWRm77]